MSFEQTLQCVTDIDETWPHHVESHHTAHAPLVVEGHIDCHGELLLLRHGAKIIDSSLVKHVIEAHQEPPSPKQSSSQ